MSNLTVGSPYVHYQKSLVGKEKGEKYKVWEIEVSNSIGGKGIITIWHGQEGSSKIQRKDEVIDKGNQGRNAVEQAVFEAEARVKKQEDKHYRETKEELEDLPVLAMLSKDHTKDGKEATVEKGVYTSRKLDGVRCVAKCRWKLSGVEITIESRTGQLWDVPHIVQELHQIMKPGDILDGELYVHGPSLQEITSAVKRVDSKEKWDKAEAKYMKYAESSTCTQDKVDSLAQDLADAKRIHEIRQNLELRVFDIVVMDTPFEERLNLLEHYVSSRFFEGGKVVEVKYNFAQSLEELKTLLIAYVNEGYEGLMYRTRDGEYESGKRSAGLWKFKLFLDEEFEIIGKHVDKQGYVVFELINNIKSERTDIPNVRYRDGYALFDCVMGDYEWRLEAASEKVLYTGQYMTVQFFSRYKGTLLPQFPTGKVIRAGKIIDGKFVPSE